MTFPSSSRSRRPSFSRVAIGAKSRRYRRAPRPYELADRLEVGRERLAGAGEGNDRPHRLVSSSRPGAERRRLPQVDCLGRDDQLDRGDSLTEADHFGDAAGCQRREGHAVLDALGLRRARELEGDRLGEQARLAGERHADVAELGEAVLVPRARGEAVRQPGERRLEELHLALVRRGKGGGERDPEEVERGREGRDLDVQAGHDLPPPRRRRAGSTATS